MFKIKADPAIILKLFKAMDTIADEVTLDITKESIKIREMDPSRVAMIDIVLPRDMFQEYEIQKRLDTEETQACLSVSEFLKLLKRKGKAEAVELSLVAEETKLKVSFIKEKNVRDFTMKMMEPSRTEELPIPKVTYNFIAKMETSELQEKLEDADLVSDMIRLIGNSELLMFEAIGDLMTFRGQMNKGSGALLSIEAKESSKATYTLTYLTDIVKEASALADVVAIEFSQDMPLKLDFQIAQGQLVYYLAPRIEID